MRAEIRELQKSLGITAIYVTHDQEEAMSMSDRIALMNAGRLEQVGVPVDIYRHPVSRFAAEFMGTTNLLAARALGRSDGALVSLRPEALRFAADAPAGWPVLSGAVVRVELLGPIVRLDLRLGDGTILKAALLDAPEYQVQAGAAVRLAYDPGAAHGPAVAPPLRQAAFTAVKSSPQRATRRFACPSGLQGLPSAHTAMHLDRKSSNSTIARTSFI